ncbi:pseudouridine-5'-phosphate glycosidase [Pseudonocardia xishanensis]|uniref:Pseudouridine-5'-phosphate glycosidase n=1 Tax=Pseudonocardia xishanensis TaxID=630995 RepID=A0ABP8S1N5_9PSEU
MTGRLVIADEVRAALADGLGVVALESSPVAHSGPPLGGVEIAAETEGAVREAGAVPATVAVLDGVLRVGLGSADLVRLAEAGAAAAKVGPRDLPACLASMGLGATTIGGTLTIAGLAGIRFTAASGLGGVHRGFADHLDISADITEVARTPVLVVASGVKSILNVPATAELLETLSVPVLGWRTDTLPVYYTGKGGPAVSTRVETVEEVAEIVHHHWNTLARAGGVLLGLPPSQDLDDVESLIGDALVAADADGVTGPAITPYVMSRVHRASGGRTAEAGRRLMIENSRLAGAVAAAHARAW